MSNFHSIKSILKTAALSSTIVLLSAGVGFSACSIAQGTGEALSMERATQLAQRDAARQVGNNYSQANFSEPICIAIDRTDGAPTYNCEVDLSVCDDNGPRVVDGAENRNHKRKIFGSWKSNIRFGSYEKSYSNSCLSFTATSKHRTDIKSIRLAERSLDKSLRKHTGYGFQSEQVSVEDPQCWEASTGIVSCTIKAKVCD